MSDTADAASSSTKCPKFEPLDFDNSFKELRSYCLGGKPLCLVASLPDPVTMYVHQRSAAVNALAAAGSLAHAAYQMAPGAAQDTAIENLVKSDPVNVMRLRYGVITQNGSYLLKSSGLKSATVVGI